MPQRAATHHLPLWGQHAGLGAEPMALLGAQAVAHYGDPEAEYRLAAESVGVVDLGFLSAVRCEGRDHREYLNRRLSQKTDDLADGDARRSALLGAEGRMQADVELLALGDATLALSTPASSADSIHSLFDMYVFTEDARFEPATGSVAVFAVTGPKAASMLAALGLAPPAAGRYAQRAFGGGEVLAWESGFAPGGWAVLAPAPEGEALWQRLGQAAVASGGGPVGFLAFDTLRIEAGAPWWGIDLDEKTIPLDANLLAAVHFDKGCYPGQETIAKITNLGHPARQLVGVLFDAEEPLPAGSELSAGGAAAGRLTSSSYSPRARRAVGLAMLRWAQRAPGTKLDCGGVSGEVVELPMRR
ncbi:MAG: glycine cleavage T C-terminal barrel domain-containing protein [Candidatus Sumerlaeia bacterium]|nr:glycine cleavage T C-terminal barrel domain-containing protein [Candidatus Sumerlaeia bacterium]